MRLLGGSGITAGAVSIYIGIQGALKPPLHPKFCNMSKHVDVIPLYEAEHAPPGGVYCILQHSKWRWNILPACGRFWPNFKVSVTGRR